MPHAPSPSRQSQPPMHSFDTPESHPSQMKIKSVRTNMTSYIFIFFISNYLKCQLGTYFQKINFLAYSSYHYKYNHPHQKEVNTSNCLENELHFQLERLINARFSGAEPHRLPSIYGNQSDFSELLRTPQKGTLR